MDENNVFGFWVRWTWRVRVSKEYRNLSCTSCLFSTTFLQNFTSKYTSMVSSLPLYNILSTAVNGFWFPWYLYMLGIDTSWWRPYLIVVFMISWFCTRYSCDATVLLSIQQSQGETGASHVYHSTKYSIACRHIWTDAVMPHDSNISAFEHFVLRTVLRTRYFRLRSWYNW